MENPDYIIPGASKTGTEWLRLCLREHPGVFIPGGPTLDFFSENYEKGGKWYRSFFEDAEPHQVTCEKSTSYFSHPVAPKRIHDWNEDVKLIFILRDPVERAYSHYCMKLKAGEVSEDIDREMTKGTPIVDEGFYFSNIKKYKKIFNIENIKINFFDDLKENDKKFLEDIFCYMGVEETFRPSILGEKYHKRKKRSRFPSIYRALVKANKEMRRWSKIYRNIFEEIVKKGITRPIHWVNNSEDFPELPEETEARLKSMYENEVRGIRQLTGRDLPMWL
jgi:hypothetical protein